MLKNNRSSLRIPWQMIALCVGIATFIVFFPALQNGFVNLDDDKNFLLNPHYRGLGWEQLKWMFTTSIMGHYIPVTWLTLGFDYVLWGMNPRGYHLTGVILHALNAIVFFFLCRRLFETPPARIGIDEAGLKGASAYAALFFALHPLRVDSVAWITERRDVVSGLFFLLTVLTYLKSREPYRSKWRLLSIGLCCLMFLSRNNLAPLVGALLILDVYFLNRQKNQIDWTGPTARELVREKIPYFVLAMIGSAAIVWAHVKFGALHFPEDASGKLYRVARVFYTLAFHIRKTIYPDNLLPMYTRSLDLNPWENRFILSALFVLAMTAVLWRLRKKWPAVAAVAVYYIVMLSPTLGIAESWSLTNDHFSYLSCLGWALLAGAGAGMVWSLGTTKRRLCLVILATGHLGLLSFATRKQVGHWKDSETLWTYVLSKDTDCLFAYNNLGHVYLERGEDDRALDLFLQAVRLKPVFLPSTQNAAFVLEKQGRVPEAVQLYKNAIQHNQPGVSFRANLDLGNLFWRAGNLDGAYSCYLEALKIQPQSAATHNNAGKILLQKGKLGEAKTFFERAVAIEPLRGEYHSNLGFALVSLGEMRQGVSCYQRAIQLDPRDSIAYYRLGLAAERERDIRAALHYYQTALRFNPSLLPVKKRIVSLSTS